jgi:hypothetical protein
VADDLDLAVLDGIDEVAVGALLEDHLARLVLQVLGRPRLPRGDPGSTLNP